MSQRDTARNDVESGDSLLAGESSDHLVIGEAVGGDDSGKHSFSIDAEDPCTDSTPVAHGDGTFHDRGWAYAFKINVTITIVAAFCFGSLAFEAISADRKHGGWGRRHLSDSEHEFGWFSAVVVGLGLVAVVVGFAMLVLHFLINCGKTVVWSSMALISLIWLLTTVQFAKAGMSLPAIMAVVVFGVFARAIYRARARFPFGAITLKVAATAIKSMPGTIFTSLGMICVQLTWISLSLVAALGSFAFLETVEGSDGSMHRAIHCGHHEDLTREDTSGCYCIGEKVSEGACKYRGLGAPLMALWMVPMLWGCFVMKNIVTSTVSGSVAAWWYSPDDVKPVKGALYRATRYSFGTLCKAAFLVNTANFLMSILKILLRFVPGASCLLRAAFAGIVYMLKYTVTFVGIYGLDLASAFRRVREVFGRRGKTYLANDSIVNFTIFFLSLSMSFAFGIVMSVVLIGIMADAKPSFQVVATIVFGYVAFLFTLVTVMEVVRSGVKAVLVCFVQDPEILKTTRGDELYDELISAWVKIHPEDEPRNIAGHPTEPINATHDQTQ